MAVPVRNSGSFAVNGGDSERFPSGRMGSPTGSAGNTTWLARPGRWGSGMDIGGRGALSDGFIGYGYGHLGGPHGPDRGNFPMPWPSSDNSVWWTGYGAQEGGVWPAALTRCSTILTSSVMGTPWKITRAFDPNPLRSPQWLINPTLANTTRGDNFPIWPVSKRLRAGELWSSLLFNALNWGRGGVLFQEDQQGQPLAGSFALIDPWSIEPDYDGDGGWVFQPLSDDPVITDADGRFRLGETTWRVVVMRGLPPHDEASGLWFGGVIPRHFSSVDEMRRIQEFTAQMFNAPTPSGVLKVSQPAGFTPESAQELKRSWLDSHGGKNGGGVAILNSTVDFQPINRGKLLDMDLTAVHRMSLMSIAHAYTLSAVWLDNSADSMTYRNLQDARTDYVDQSGRAFGGLFEQFIDELLPAGQRLSIQWSRYIQPSQEALAEAWLPVLQAGAISVDEFRAKVDMAPVNSAQVYDDDDRR